MKKGRYERETTKKTPVWPIILIAVLAVALVGAVLLFVSGYFDFGQNEIGDNSLAVPTDSVAVDATELPVRQTDPEDETASQTEAAQPDEDVQETTPETDETQVAPVETAPPSVEIVQRVDAEYEKWLSAAMIIGVSMEYPDFQPVGIYAASATSLEDKMLSEGVYIVFISGGNQIVIHSKALEGERTTPGTTDISSETIGFATFDEVDAASVDFSAMREITLDDLSELISQSMMVSIYTR